MKRNRVLDSKRRSKYKRDRRKPPSFHMTDRDIEILRALNRYRYLRTGQVHDLLFSENTTNQSAQRRLRGLYHHGYINRAKPYVQVGQPEPEITYYLDRKGRNLLRSLGDEEVYLWRKNGNVKYHFLEHAVAISQFRVHLERAVAVMDDVEIELFIPEFQMRRAAEDYAGRKRYLLFREAFHPVHQENFVVHPDALIVLSRLVKGSKRHLMLCLEVDRGTEGLGQIRDKLTGYQLAKEQKLFRPIADIPNFFVLFQASTERRATSIFHGLVDHVGAEITRVGSAEEVNAESILNANIWKDAEGQRKAILRGS